MVLKGVAKHTDTRGASVRVPASPAPGDALETPETSGWERDAAILRDRLLGAPGGPTDPLREHLVELLHYRSIAAEMEVRDDVPELLAKLVSSAFPSPPPPIS